MRIGRHRILKQDCEFGVAQIVEIAIRALSPAVNDTFTGVGCVDWLADALLIVADVSLSDGCWYDHGGKLRVRVPPLRLERLVKTAFDQIRQAAAENPAVLIRILDAIRRMTPRMPTEAARQALIAQADAVREVAQTKILVKLDRDDIEAAWQRIQPAEEAFSVRRRSSGWAAEILSQEALELFMFCRHRLKLEPIGRWMRTLRRAIYRLDRAECTNSASATGLHRWP